MLWWRLFREVLILYSLSVEKPEEGGLKGGAGEREF